MVSSLLVQRSLHLRRTDLLIFYCIARFRTTMTLTPRQHHPMLRIAALSMIISAAIVIQRLDAFSPPLSSRIRTSRQIQIRRSRHYMSDGVEGGGGIPEPTTFREAEVIGLRFMQEDACDALAWQVFHERLARLSHASAPMLRSVATQPRPICEHGVPHG